MYSKSTILQRMDLYRIDGGGIGSWLTDSTCEAVFHRLGSIDEEPLSAVQLNQLLVLAHEAPVSDGFYTYYWLRAPSTHPYDVSALPHFKYAWLQAGALVSLDHLSWGLHRLYMDGLLYFGNVRTAFRQLRELSENSLSTFFAAKRVDTDAIRRRGPPLPLKPIDKDKRYLISEMACKSYGDDPKIKSDLRSALTQSYESLVSSGAQISTIQDLLEKHLPPEFNDRKESLQFSASEILTRTATSSADVTAFYLDVAQQFDQARHDALKNTQFYLSMLTDLDVYVATSMRTRQHFLKMAQTCETIFSDARLRSMNLRYFDPTLSAADGHEDKGLIECLMVKCAKALVYCGGEKESYGKDAEAAMALSLGRPVIFYCEQRAPFYREVHPLTRLIEFQTGIAVGAMVTDRLDDVAELLSRTFENRMEYRLERSKNGSLRLKETVTGSVVRLQTSDKLLTETFWNHYHQDRNPPQSLRPAASVTAIAPLRHTRRTGGDTPQSQGELGLVSTSELVSLAARRSSEGSSSQPESGRKGVSPSPSRMNAPLLLTPAEVFDGIAKLKRTQATGAKRFAVFSQWLETNHVSLAEGAKLLRFIEATLETLQARPSHVYTPSDMARWYGQMSNGDDVGSL